VYATGAEGLTIRNSRFYNCATMDLFFTNWAGGPDYGNVTLENNVFEHSTMETPGSWHYYSLYVGNTGPTGGALTNWLVRNNTFEIDAFLSRETASGSRWVGNLGGWSCVSGVEYRFNVGSRCSAADKAVAPDSSSKTQTAPFGWVDPAGHNFRLTAGSAAIDAADPHDAPATDNDGYRRDARPDAGAHEFGAGPESGTGSPPTTAAPSGSGGAALRIRSAKLSPRTICRRARKRCAGSAKLRLSLSGPARVTIVLSRSGSGKRARSLSRTVRTSRSITLRARGLRAGRYKVRVRTQTSPALTRTFGLRVT
jgi:hypothetical protein